MIRVMMKSTRPADSRADSCASEASLKLVAMSAEMVFVPVSMTRGLRISAWLMMRTTAIVSPRARPSP